MPHIQPSPTLPPTPPHTERGGYLGGLDTSQKLCMPYFSTSSVQLLFHDVTRLPPGDSEKQLSRKRHVGNDFVQVIWSDNPRDYSPHTIRSKMTMVRSIFFCMIIRVVLFTHAHAIVFTHTYILTLTHTHRAA